MSDLGFLIGSKLLVIVLWTKGHRFGLGREKVGRVLGIQFDDESSSIYII